jgi:hypothetical protein
MQVVSTGYVRPCCFGAAPIGNLNDGRSLAEIANGEEARALRGQLLTGELGQECRNCNARDVVPVEAFRNRVADFLRNSDLPEADAAPTMQAASG